MPRRPNPSSTGSPPSADQLRRRRRPPPPSLGQPPQTTSCMDLAPENLAARTGGRVQEAFPRPVRAQIRARLHLSVHLSSLRKLSSLYLEVVTYHLSPL
jgi:hypothetical protein